MPFSGGRRLFSRPPDACSSGVLSPLSPVTCVVLGWGVAFLRRRSGPLLFRSRLLDCWGCLRTASSGVGIILYLAWSYRQFSREEGSHLRAWWRVLRLLMPRRLYLSSGGVWWWVGLRVVLGFWLHWFPVKSSSLCLLCGPPSSSLVVVVLRVSSVVVPLVCFPRLLVAWRWCSMAHLVCDSFGSCSLFALFIPQI